MVEVHQWQHLAREDDGSVVCDKGHACSPLNLLQGEALGRVVPCPRCTLSRQNPPFGFSLAAVRRLGGQAEGGHSSALAGLRCLVCGDGGIDVVPRSEIYDPEVCWIHPMGPNRDHSERISMSLARESAGRGCMLRIETGDDFSKLRSLKKKPVVVACVSDVSRIRDALTHGVAAGLASIVIVVLPQPDEHPLMLGGGGFRQAAVSLSVSVHEDAGVGLREADGEIRAVSLDLRRETLSGNGLFRDEAVCCLFGCLVSMLSHSDLRAAASWAS
eukprot:CAMPEP_0169471848 /NCGR_PEP_ID=MMETSP1042-20121227/24824_1 /TAXON_ID=464988 /ORGANISM="Hemiselmis andersenii, Strain CCMP1180" /LENGTH=272 /DNA_ID=CAMNT_0009585603 /DNA_START=304 /DNA_END=1119 /DNA_ORIENTATION=+